MRYLKQLSYLCALLKLACWMHISPIPSMIADYMGSVVVGCISAFQFQQKELSVAS